MRFRPLMLLCASALAAQDRDLLGPQRPVVERLCASCHGGDAEKGGFGVPGPAAERGATLVAFARMRRRVATAQMPPAAEEQPTAEERAGLLRALDDALWREVPALRAAPAHVTIRRLNAAQWRRTVAALFGVEVDTSGFPADDLGYGFDTIGDALSFSALHLECQLAAAGRVAAAVFDGEDPAHPGVRHLEADAMAVDGDAPVVFASGSAALITNATIAGGVELPRDGRYRVRVSARADQAGGELAKMAVKWDGRELDRFEIAGRKLQDVDLVAPLTGGRHRLGIAFLNDYYDPKNPDPAQRDRNLHVASVDVIGPLDPRATPPAQQWIHAAANGKGGAAERLVAVARALLPRAFRRPVREDEVRRHAAVGQGVLAGGDGETAALRAVVQSALSSPSFLFRVEAGDGGANVPAVAMASRLSYFLWASMPDERLMALGRAGKLTDPAIVHAEAERLLDDPRADSLATEFAAHWLELGNLAERAPDPVLFPGFDDALRTAMQRETELLFAAVLRERRDVRDLLDCDFTYVDPTLAAFYGLPYPEGAEGFARVPLPTALRDRGGLLGHASVLAVTSNPTRTSPVKRGKWILDNLLGDPPPPPPPGNAALPDERRTVDNTRSFREQLAAHRADSKCAGCHARMDALGLALERFDAVGRGRDRDAGGPIDCRGELPDGSPVDGIAGLKRVLRDDPAVPGTIARKLFVYGIGREPGAVEGLQLDHVVEAMRRTGKVTLRGLVLAVVDSDAFRLREVEHGR